MLYTSIMILKKAWLLLWNFAWLWGRFIFHRNI